jgi:hypothetical protein
MATTAHLVQKTARLLGPLMGRVNQMRRRHMALCARLSLCPRPALPRDAFLSAQCWRTVSTRTGCTCGPKLSYSATDSSQAPC